MPESLSVGDKIPYVRPIGIVGFRLDVPVWHALTVRPGKETASCRAFKASGNFAFYPEREKSFFIRHKKYTRKYPQITGLIYVKFNRAPNWHIIRERGISTGVMSIGNKPIAFPNAIIRKLQGLPDREDALRKARAELTQVAAGDIAAMTEGPLEGYFVQVDWVAKDGTVFWMHDLFKGQSAPGVLAQKDGPTEGEVQARADEIMRAAE